ncbi:hypothetical protein [Metamycoplasma buccale]|uniref:hypothetical protein n=1 Tax=Metamycoplasma buccale TaxID=55602 RepID=UPI00398EF2F8
MSSQIYVTTNGNNPTVFAPLIWELLDKFDAFNYVDETKPNAKMENLSEWLFEIERFVIFWKMIQFRGQSMSQSAWKLAQKVKKGEINSPINLRKSLKELLPDLFNLKTIDQINNNLREEFKVKFANKDQKVSPHKEIKRLLLIRINFYLQNIKNDKHSLIINKKQHGLK